MSPALLNRQVLILNQNYEPLSVCDARKAVVLIYLGKAEIVERDGVNLRSVRSQMPLPVVVRLSLFVRTRAKRIVLTRKNIIKRDGHQCQYCGRMDGAMTVDHVVPRTRKGADTWENLVAACLPCNNRKGNRTPEQAHMTLRRAPRRPTYLTFIQHFVGLHSEKWRPYLFMG